MACDSIQPLRFEPKLTEKVRRRSFGEHAAAATCEVLISAKPQGSLYKVTEWIVDAIDGLAEVLTDVALLDFVGVNRCRRLPARSVPAS